MVRLLEAGVEFLRERLGDVLEAPPVELVPVLQLGTGTGSRIRFERAGAGLVRTPVRGVDGTGDEMRIYHGWTATGLDVELLPCDVVAVGVVMVPGGREILELDLPGGPARIERPGDSAKFYLQWPPPARWNITVLGQER